MKYSGAEITIKLLERQGIEIIAGIPGGFNLPLYDALYKSSIRHILTRHEQGAGFLAQGMARSTGKPAVCFATSGPGATNLITAIADAKLDSIPVIAITGQVPLSMIGTDAFQEVDTYGMSMPVTKHNFLVRSAAELFEIIPEAFRIACSGRPGPVLVDIPKCVQQELVDFESWPQPWTPEKPRSADKDELSRAAEMISRAERPLLCIGGGALHAGASGELIELAHKNSIPVVTTMMGIGAFPSDDPLCLGMFGMHGTRSTNTIVGQCDLFIACGTRFGDRSTGKVANFCLKSDILQIDIDKSEFGKIMKSTARITGDLKEVASALLSAVPENPRDEWLSHIRKLRQSFPFPASKSTDVLHPHNLLRTVYSLSSPDTIITTDVGQHQMWVAQIYPISRPRSFLSSGGLGTMGFGLPAAIGAALANPDKPVICFTGDGSLLMNIQELATLSDYRLNVKIIVFNNGHLGLVRQQQELFYNGNYIASRFLTNPDFKTIAAGFGICGIDLGNEKEVVAALSEALKKEEPCLINVPIHHGWNVMPMVPPGKANSEMIGD
ncbi:MAG: biosynthetic-type acetolactate synthase large subunit [Fibrobacter sp.]|nr:biosynthetic-type acetolactate synthase large subunit [Fibrobacter sp.]